MPTTFALRSQSQRHIPPACWPPAGRRERQHHHRDMATDQVADRLTIALIGKQDAAVLWQKC